MRWILVFIFLYLIPLIILFRNYKNFKRSCIYGSMYVVLATTIVISNVYISGLNSIKESMYYQNYALDSRYQDKYDSNFEEEEEVKKEPKEEPEDAFIDKQASNITNRDNEYNNKISKDTNDKEFKDESDDRVSSDLENIYNFKKEVYSIERQALMPMRDCMPYTKDISKNIKRLDSIKKDIVYARDMCREVVSEYENMEIQGLSDDKYTKVLYNARDDVKKTYELREKAMNSAIKLVDTKSPKYIGQITEYLDLSDKHIESFKERVEDLKQKVQQDQNK
ncbi:hypothetical protein [Asaccharospora irregularis]|uniref:Uncharacterized protein n=1 Tax=Asaccharospora irregularis DSM 2635 TaxID=1121321 RepID=A0A1M5QXP2_9FIRM|nr:hypothetical protein [Asaccharospora irregularis]SHH18905.1 hypothetical protein SAMN04488530_12513 [Asaccharospora irregularis DSM 2635]